MYLQRGRYRARAQMVGENMNVVASVGECLGKPQNSDWCATGEWKRARGNYGDAIALIQCSIIAGLLEH